MAEQSPFERLHDEPDVDTSVSDLLDQLNLPPVFADYLRKNKKAIWMVIAVAAIVITTVSLYDTYTDYQRNKAESALTSALNADDKDKEKLLQDITKEYASTPTALWGQIELSHLAVNKGENDEAMELLKAVNQKVKPLNPLKPLLLQRLAVLAENGGYLDQALKYYEEQATIKSFEAAAYQAMGRIYEVQADNSLALEMYEKYLQLTDASEGTSGNDQFRSVVQARVNFLKK